MTKAWLVLADGRRFEGTRFGAEGDAVGEAVFTTGMTGYQEVLTDPSYCDQLVTMTAPQIGNTGVNDADPEARRPFLSGFVVHELSLNASSWRSEGELDDYLRTHDIAGIHGVDTRALTRHIRDQGAQMGVIAADPETAHELAKKAAPMEGRDLTGRVTTEETYAWDMSSGVWSSTTQTAGEAPHVVALDFGIKRNILRSLVDAGCRVTVVPAKTSADDVLALNPDGVFLSNGPGDPAAVGYALPTIQALLGTKPIFGICLGHQLLGLALGGRTYKLKFGHRGLNQPVKDLKTGRVEITTQNHGFVLDGESVGDGIEVTHLHLNDATCMGIDAPKQNAFGVQFHPEAAAGPHDTQHLFGRFVHRMRG